jgi:hypothetical protein
MSSQRRQTGNIWRPAFERAVMAGVLTGGVSRGGSSTTTASEKSDITLALAATRWMSGQAQPTLRTTSSNDKRCVLQQTKGCCRRP